MTCVVLQVDLDLFLCDLSLYSLVEGLHCAVVWRN